MSTSSSPVILEIRSQMLDFELEDAPPIGRTESGKPRPSLTLCYAPQTSRMMSYRLHTGAPDRYTIASVLHEALIQLHEQPEGTITEEQSHQSSISFGPCIQSTFYSQGILLRFVSPDQRFSGAIERFFLTLNQRLWYSVLIEKDDQGAQPEKKIAHITLAEIERMLSRFSRRKCHTVGSMVEQHSQDCSSTKGADPPVFSLLLEELNHQNTTTRSKRGQEPRVEPGECADLPVGMSIVVILDSSLLETQEVFSPDEPIGPGDKREEQPALAHPEMSTPGERTPFPREEEKN